MTELKPCPFCGEQAKTQVRVLHADVIDFSVVCPSCGIEKTSRLKVTQACTGADVEKAMNSVIEAWNRRAADDKPEPIKRPKPLGYEIGGGFGKRRRVEDD